MRLFQRFLDNNGMATAANLAESDFDSSIYSEQKSYIAPYINEPPENMVHSICRLFFGNIQW